MSKVFLFGIDGSAPDLIFDEWIDELPTIKKLMSKGLYAEMNSTVPPSTIIAWNAMVSGKDASEMGVFSFTYKDEAGQTQLVNSKNIKTERIWNILDKQGKKSIVMFVPLTFPVQPLNGVMVSGFLSPLISEKSVYPHDFVDKVKSAAGDELFFDVAVGLGSHKALDVPTLLKNTYEMTDKQLSLLENLLVNEEWDFFMSVMIGTDRLQHMLWRHFDKNHRRFINNSEYKDSLKEYYNYLDKRLGKIIGMLDDETTIIVASDHGMVRQEGKINLNNWLIEKGYLVLTDAANDLIKKDKTRFKFEFVDMGKSKAYSSGAYNARVFLNRSLLGNDFDQFREKLIQEIKEIPDDQGRKIGTEVFKKEDVYQMPNNPECPDLTVYFDGLKWASNPDLGQEGLYSWQTAVGADNAGHSKKGILIMGGYGVDSKGKIGDVDIKQVAPTILGLLGADKPTDIKINEIEVK